MDHERFLMRSYAAWLDLRARMLERLRQIRQGACTRAERLLLALELPDPLHRDLVTWRTMEMWDEQAGKGRGLWTRERVRRVLRDATDRDGGRYHWGWDRRRGGAT